MTDANRTLYRLKAESAWSTAPGGTYDEIGITDESLGKDASFVRSRTLRSDRKTIAQVLQRSNGSGGINVESIYGNADQLLQGVLLSSAWSSPVTNTGSYSISGTTWSGTGIGAGVTAGQHARFKDGATRIGYAKVVTAGANELTVDRSIGNVTGSGDEEVEIGAQIVDGTSFQSFTIEREHLAVATPTVIDRALGFTPNTWSYRIPTDDVHTMSFGFLGKDMLHNESSSDASGTNAQVTNKPIVSAEAGGPLYYVIGGTAYSLVGWEINYNNNLRTRAQAGSSTPIGIGTGGIAISGTGSMYFDSGGPAAVADLAEAMTETGQYVVVEDIDGNAYAIDTPNVRLHTPRTVAGGQDSDVVLAFRWEGANESTEDVMARIHRWAA